MGNVIPEFCDPPIRISTREAKPIDFPQLILGKSPRSDFLETYADGQMRKEVNASDAAHEAIADIEKKLKNRLNAKVHRLFRTKFSHETQY